jgi:hypothetical protein
MYNAKSKVTLDHCNHAVFFFVFLSPFNKQIGIFFENLCLFSANSTSFSIFRKVLQCFQYNKTEEKRKKKQVLFLVMNFFILDFFSQQCKNMNKID